jgi:type IV pilus assembly protein PilE
MGMTRARQRGVTLLELMTVVMIIGVLASIAIPSYRSYLMRAQRSDATAALLRLAAAQEKFYLQNNRYATNAELALGPPAGLGFARTEHNFYTLSLAAGLDNTLQFLATATPITTGPQSKDAACATFTIDQQGTRGAKNSASSVTTDTCWR